MYTILLVLALAIVSESSTKYQYPKGLPCKVYNKNKLDCSDRKLLTIPPLKGQHIRSLNLSHNLLQTVDGASFVHLRSLEMLDLSHNRLRNIRFDAIMSLRELELSSNNIDNISIATFAGLCELETLDLSQQDGITLLGSPFRSTPYLKRLNLAQCSLYKQPLVPTVFRGLHGLQELDISDNFIGLPDSIFQGMTHLTRLKAPNNNIRILPKSTEDLTSLTHLNLAFNSLMEMETYFANLTRLEYLDITLNSISSIPCEVMDCLQSLKTLDIRWNYIHYLPCPLGKVTSLTKIRISRHLMNTLPEYWNSTKWMELITRLPTSLSDLELDVAGQGIFQSVNNTTRNSSIQSLTVSYCNVLGLAIEDDAFVMFPFLKQLRMSAVCYSGYSPKKYVLNISRYAFRGLLYLESLELRNNGITSLSRAFALNSLKHLDLSYNNIKSASVYPSLALESLNISNNPIDVVDLESFWNISALYLNNITSSKFVMTTSNSNLRSIQISGGSTSGATTIDYRISEPFCTVSPMLEEVTFSNIKFKDPDDWTTSFVWGNCSHMKSLALYNIEGNILDKNGIARFTQYEKLVLRNFELSSIDNFLLESPNLRYLDLRSNKIETLESNNFSFLLNLHYMDLSHNRINTLPEHQFYHMSNLHYLNLADNKIASLNVLEGLTNLQTLIVSDNVMTTLPVFFMKSPYKLLYLELGNNSFSCTCDITPLQRWLISDMKTYIDPQSEYRCKSPTNRYNSGLTEFTLDCSIHLEAYVTPSLLVLIILLITSVVAYKHRWYIHFKYWALVHQKRYQRYVDNDDDAAILNSDDEDDVDAREAPIMRRRYHAYVAYHRESEAWVNDQLVATIEDGPEQFRLCMKERGDVPAGHYILNAICHGIYKSRKTIIVLSKNFMNDGWCHYQLQIARMRLVRDNEDVIILVQIGQIPEDNKTLLLRQILCNKEVLIWSEDPIRQLLFWNRLKMKLRRPARVDRRYEEV